MAKKKKIKIPKSVLELRYSEKKFAKKHDIRLKGKHLSKREKKHNLKRLNHEYSEAAINAMNKAVKILAENNEDNKKIQKVKDGVENIINNPAIMKRIAKIYKKNPENYQNMLYLPNMIMNTLVYYSQEDLSEDEKKIAESLDKEGLVEFCEKILKKQIKRYAKSGLSDEMAFSLATVIPTAKLFKNNRQWYKKLIQQMYSMAETTSVDIELIIKSVLKVDKKRVISKKEFLAKFFSELIFQRGSNKTAKFTDSQKELHENLIERALIYLDGCKSGKLKDILKMYIKRRQKAEEYKNDGKRIIKFVDYANSNSEYTNLKSVIMELLADNSSNELYLS